MPGFEPRPHWWEASAVNIYMLLGKQKATVKQATKTCNLFCNIAAKQVEKLCCAFNLQC